MTASDAVPPTRVCARSWTSWPATRSTTGELGSARHVGLHRSGERTTAGVAADRVAVSVVTLGELELGELELGVLHAVDHEARARRAATLSLARVADPLPVTEAVMSAWARLVRDCRLASIHRTVRLVDALVGATAVVHGVPVVTQDGDFDRIAAAHPDLRVLRV